MFRKTCPQLFVQSLLRKFQYVLELSLVYGEELLAGIGMALFFFVLGLCCGLSLQDSIALSALGAVLYAVFYIVKVAVLRLVALIPATTRRRIWLTFSTAHAVAVSVVGAFVIGIFSLILLIGLPLGWTIAFAIVTSIVALWLIADHMIRSIYCLKTTPMWQRPLDVIIRKVCK